CWHCASAGGGPMMASAATTAAANPVTPNLLSAFTFILVALPLAQRASARVASSLGAGPALDSVASRRWQSIVKEKILESVQPCREGWNRWESLSTDAGVWCRPRNKPLSGGRTSG